MSAEDLAGRIRQWSNGSRRVRGEWLSGGYAERTIGVLVNGARGSRGGSEGAERSLLGHVREKMLG